MSGWGMGWFGGGAAAKKKEAPKNAILGLRSTLDMLTKREKHLQNQIDEQDAAARKYVKTNPNAAKTALRRKKALESTLEQTSAHMMTVEREISSIETANINKETMDAMKNASAAMKQIHNGLTIDKVDATMEDLGEQHAIAQEIGEALRGGPGANDINEDDLEAELQELQDAETDKSLADAGTVPVGDKVSRLPAAATGELKSSAQTEEEDEEAELAKLKAEMAM